MKLTPASRSAVGNEKPAQHDAVDHRELRGDGADADGEDEDGERAEALLLDEDAQADPNVADGVFGDHGQAPPLRGTGVTSKSHTHRAAGRFQPSRNGGMLESQAVVEDEQEE